MQKWLLKLSTTNIYKIMILSLLINALFGLTITNLSVIIQIAISVLTAFLIESLIFYVRYKKFVFSDSSIITGLFVSLILAPNQNFYVYIFAATVAILSKHIISYNNKHLFNPAMFGIVLSIFLFDASQSWWGASNIVPVIILGLWINYKFKRLNLSLTFLIFYFSLVLLYGFVNNSLSFAEIVNPVVYFFAMYMLIEPRTSPVLSKQRTFYGLLSGFIIFFTVTFLPVYNISLGLLISNILAFIINKLK